MSKKKVSKKKVCTTFKIDDGENEEVKTSCGTVEKKHATEEEMKKLSNSFITVLGFMAFLVILFFTIYYIVNSSSTSTFKGTEYVKLQEGDVTFYHTKIPYELDNGQKTHYNIYLRTNPQKNGKKVSFEDDKNIPWKQVVVLNFFTEGISCDGDVIIAQANLQQILSGAMKMDLFRDEEAFCDEEEEARYMYLEVVPGEETKIEKLGEACYRLSFSDCKVLDVTERFAIEAVSRYNELHK